ncbi:hypothetical protein QVD17_24714 [Tagetes erecta]|uniref:Uncharacterized protein n=1 Tax=Tagetes erecta TaxID=13708 RepID=A0AAD8KIC3_TARER|nr:hypothetical protein QVD17_24714 [Tagetes erecta]
MSSSSSHKSLAILAPLFFLLLSTGFGRKMTPSSTTHDGYAYASPPLIEEMGGRSREMIELDYDDAGPNTNKRSGLNLPVPHPDPEAPSPQP